MSDNKNVEYYLIRSDVLPEVFRKVMQVKRLVDKEEGISINEATKRVKISRSAFYKYRDAVQLAKIENATVVALLIELENLENILLRCIKTINSNGAHVSSFNVINSKAGSRHALMTLAADKEDLSWHSLTHKLQEVRGVINVTLL